MWYDGERGSRVLYRVSDDAIRDMGHWNQDSAQHRHYSSTPHPGHAAIAHHHGTPGEDPMLSYACGHAALVPSDQILAFVMPKVMILDDFTVLDIVQAIKYVEAELRTNPKSAGLQAMKSLTWLPKL